MTYFAVISTLSVNNHPYVGAKQSAVTETVRCKQLNRIIHLTPHFNETSFFIHKVCQKTSQKRRNFQQMARTPAPAIHKIRCQPFTNSHCSQKTDMTNPITLSLSNSRADRFQFSFKLEMVSQVIVKHVTVYHYRHLDELTA